MTAKPYSESCDQNKYPILDVLKAEISHCQKVLEIGSGTGQHALFFAGQFPLLQWQTSDRRDQHAGINAWLNDQPTPNVLSPLALDVRGDSWPSVLFDGVFSANTAHIMSWPDVVAMFAGVGRVLREDGVFCLYGPFNYNGQYTSASNERFDIWLKIQNPQQGIRNFEDLNHLATQNRMKLKQDYAMPANNRTLVWVKIADG